MRLNKLNLKFRCHFWWNIFGLMAFGVLFPQVNFALEDWNYRGEAYLRNHHNELRKHYLLASPSTTFDQKRTNAIVDLEIQGDWNERLYSNLRGEWVHTAKDTESQNNARLIEGALHYEIAPTVFLDFGKILEEWGTGYAFNPVNALLNPKKPSNPTGVREGVTMVKLEVLLETISITAVVAGVPNEENHQQAFSIPDHKHKRRLAFKMDHTWEDHDFSWVHIQGGLNGKQLQDHLQGSPLTPEPLQPLTGVAWSTVVGDALELHGEYAAQTGKSRAIPVQTAEAVMAGPVQLIPPISVYRRDQHNEDRLFSKVLIGGQYTFDNDFNLALEWYFDEQGYTHQEWEKIHDAIDDAQAPSVVSFSSNSPFEGFLSQTLLNLGLTALRQNYAFFRLYTDEFGDRYSSESIVLWSADDASFLFRENLTRAWGDHWNTSVDWTTFQGAAYSTFGLNPSRHQVDLKVAYLF